MDNRFPHWTCLKCQTYWCRIDHCPAEFASVHQMLAHLRRCHLYPERTEPECNCGRPLVGRRVFTTQRYIDCNGCNSRACYRDGCYYVQLNVNTFAVHTTKHHGNDITFKCSACATQQKMRDGQLGSGQCPAPCNQFWCLRGYCTFETNQLQLLDEHATECRF